jgi:FtsZ-interacting cell division protein ZipA
MQSMDVVLIVIGVFIIIVVGMWVHAWITDPEKIDKAEEREVRSETPQEHERERFNEPSDAERNAADVEMYSRVEEGTTNSTNDDDE